MEFFQLMDKHVSVDTTVYFVPVHVADAAVEVLGQLIRHHQSTSIWELDLRSGLLWRNGAPSGKIVMGFGFYGRSFTMTDPNCYEPVGIFPGLGLLETVVGHQEF